MNTIWLKLAGGVVVLVIVLVVIGQFTGSKSPPAPQTQKAEQPKDVYDSFARDDKKFGVKFQGGDEHEANAAPPAAAAPTPQTPTAQATPPQPPKQPHFQKLSMEQEVEAQRLHSMALEERKRARLPMMSPKMMIDYCREIIQKWPKSEYAYKAKLMLDDLPERHKETYHITPQETDVSSFYQ